MRFRFPDSFHSLTVQSSRALFYCLVQNKEQKGKEVHFASILLFSLNQSLKLARKLRSRRGCAQPVVTLDHFDDERRSGEEVSRYLLVVIRWSFDCNEL